MRNFANLAAAALIVTVTPVEAWASARSTYESALAREEALRRAPAPASLADLRGATAAYQRVVRRYPSSAYCDNALWQAAGLARLAWERYGHEQDREAALTLLARLRREYSSSSLVPRIAEAVRALEPRPPDPPRRLQPAPPTEAALAPVVPGPGAAPSGVATLVQIQRSRLPDGVRITLHLDREVPYADVQLETPPRVFFDLKGVRPAADIAEPLQFPDDIVREIRLGRHPGATTRIVMPLDGVARYSAFALYDPYRVVIDFVRGQRRPETPALQSRALPSAARAVKSPVLPSPARVTKTPPLQPLKAEPLPVTSPVLPPALPAANATGGFSLSRQLGLGLSRIVIDPGHGGHDPGAQAGRLSEAELVLDVAQRLERILLKRNLEVVLTRRTDAYIPLEERTAIANREEADLFLSIHANASANTRARGVETYFLNFASNPEAEAVAARENSSSGRTMHSLPEIVRAIALNNKLDESRDLAGLVQRAMIRRLRPQNKNVRDLGVKQAPFVVLIGAAMPSVLAEISFLTNRSEGALLRTGAYRQRIAEALADAVMQYQRSLKKVASVALH
ncbi:MAG: N-acetylmuramoyl-L-alanine amidase [Vicinamibacterales bacterium]